MTTSSSKDTTANTATATIMISTEIASMACLGLTLQMTLMYLGTISQRTIDAPYNNMSWEWLPPQLSAVHYVIRDSFAIRETSLNEWLRHQPLWLTQAMTAHSMLAESSPILWFFCNNNTRLRGMGFVVLGTLHAGLLLVTRLPNWQFMGMAASVLWIPTSAWNNSSSSSSSSANDNPSEYEHKKTDDPTPNDSDNDDNDNDNDIDDNDDHDDDDDNDDDDNDDDDNDDDDNDDDDNDDDDNDDENDEKTTSSSASTASVSNVTTTNTTATTTTGDRIRKVMSGFLLFYMMYNFCGERGWISKHDGGDLGEFLRISQYWVMYAHPPKSAVVTTIMGYTTSSNEDGDNDNDDTATTIDVMQGLKTGNWNTIMPPTTTAGAPRQDGDDDDRHFVSFISHRWERALDQWGRHRDRKRAQTLLEGLCRRRHVPESIRRLVLRWTRYKIVPPNNNSSSSSDRWRPMDPPAIVVTVNCYR
jgi:hypothetical protein